MKFCPNIFIYQRYGQQKATPNGWLLILSSEKSTELLL